MDLGADRIGRDQCYSGYRTGGRRWFGATTSRFKLLKISQSLAYDFNTFHSGHSSIGRTNYLRTEESAAKKSGTE